MQLSNAVRSLGDKLHASRSQAGWRGENTQLDHIAGHDGWPIVGNTYQYMTRPFDFSAEQRARYGEVYRNHAFLMKFLTFASPDGAEFVLRDEARNFSARLGWEPFMRYLLPNTLSLMDGAEHRYYRGAMQSLFRPAAMDGYHQLVHQTVSESIEGWQTDRIIKLFPKLKALTLASAAKVFIGIDLERDLHHILRLGAIVDRGFAALVPRPVPGLSLWRALRAREALRAYFRALIPERRRSQSKDLFGVLCRTTDEHGVLLSDDAVIDQLLGLLRASSDSITGSLSVAVHHLARHPQWQERLRERSRSLGPGPLGSEELNSLQEHELFFFEALRLFPVTPQLFRRSVRDCEYRGRKIPSGTQVAVDIGYIHRSPLYWTEPLRFDPLRFAAPRLEHKRQKFQWLPFGSGAHNCIAQFFALPFAKYVLHLLLTRYRFERTDDGEFVLVLVPATFPKDGLKMRLRPLAR